MKRKIYGCNAIKRWFVGKKADWTFRLIEILILRLATVQTIKLNKIRCLDYATSFTLPLIFSFNELMMLQKNDSNHSSTFLFTAQIFEWMIKWNWKQFNILFDFQLSSPSTRRKSTIGNIENLCIREAHFMSIIISLLQNVLAHTKMLLP